MLRWIFLTGFVTSFGYTLYLFFPKNTDLPGESILGEKATRALKEVFMRCVNFVAYRADERDRKCLEVLDENPKKFFLQKVAGLTFLPVLFYLPFGYVGIAIGLLAGWYLPSLLLRSRYDHWKSAVVGEIPTFVDYLVVYFSVGYNVKRALIEAAEVVGPELSAELKKLNADIEVSKDYKGALDRFSSRINDFHVDNIIQRLKSSWDIQTSADLFETVSESLVELRKMQIEIQTSRYKLFMVVLPVLGVIGAIILVAVPLINWIIGQLGELSFTTN